MTKWTYCTFTFAICAGLLDVSPHAALAKDKPAPNTSSPSREWPTGSALISPERNEQLIEREVQLHQSDRVKQIELLKSYILEEYAGRPEVKTLKTVFAADPDEKGIEQLSVILRADERLTSVRRTYLLTLLSLWYAELKSPKIRVLISKAFDEEISIVIERRKVLSDRERRRNIPWNNLCGALSRGGSPQLISDRFWEALEIHEWRGHRVLVYLACPSILEKLES